MSFFFLPFFRVEVVFSLFCFQSSSPRKLKRARKNQTHQVVLEPRDVGDVQVVGRLVEQQDVGLHQHRARERELHLPASGERRDGRGLHLVGEADGSEDARDLVAGRGGGREDGLVVDDEVDDGGLGLGRVDVVLDVDLGVGEFFGGKRERERE